MILSEYKQEVEDEFGECTILHSKYDHEKKNCKNTEGRIAYKCVTWIDYWHAMAGMATSASSMLRKGANMFNRLLISNDLLSPWFSMSKVR